MGVQRFVISGIDSDSAQADWFTDMDCTTEIDVGEVLPDGSFTMNRLPKIADTVMDHSYTISNLKQGTKYIAEAVSYCEEEGRYVTCDDGSSPAFFETPAADGDVETMSASANAAEISVGGSAVITVTAGYSGGVPAANEKLTCNITNGRPQNRERGTFSPASPVTDSAGKAAITFTANHPGKAKIQILADNFCCELEIMVRP